MVKVSFEYVDMNCNICAPNIILQGVQQTAFEDFVCRINMNVQRVAVTPITPGRSGASIFLVRRVTNSHPLVPIIIKTAEDPSLIIEERKRYKDFVKDRLSHAPNLIAEDSLSLAYEYSSGLFLEPVTLREGYSITNPSILVPLLKRLVHVLCTWSQKYASELSNIELMDFNPALGERIKSFGYSFEKYAFLDNWWADFKRLRRSASPCELYLCHGDLNIGNVMYDVKSGDPVPILIDFGSIRNTITYWDYVKFERDLKTRGFLLEALNHGFDIHWIVKVVRKIDLSNPLLPLSPSPSDPPPKQKVQECVESLRAEIIRQTSEKDFNQAYYDSLTYCTLTLLYRNTADADIPLEHQRIVACESAAALLSRILQRRLPETIVPSDIEAHYELQGESSAGVKNYIGLDHSMFLRLIKDRVSATHYGDIRYLAIAGWEILRNEQILSALKDGDDPAQSKTLRVYLLRPDTESFKEFIRLSNEPEDIVLEKIANTKRSLKALAVSPEHTRLRIKIYLYDAIPVINMIETPEQYTFHPYKIGESQGLFNVFEVDKEIHRDTLSLMFANYFQDLAHRSKEETIKWF